MQPTFVSENKGKILIFQMSHTFVNSNNFFFLSHLDFSLYKATPNDFNSNYLNVLTIQIDLRFRKVNFSPLTRPQTKCINELIELFESNIH